ncbi:uracil-DNA glycosylase [Desulfohalovibrio reitneri]|uniref:uracil-DNA glycosylase n=1 Tax=Desulfohalovibrio reitneri TaxID=1307759 RepID=UPI000551DC06|nr:uracil-DNA glycosylase [Desulfohalovibrio reitneri]
MSRELESLARGIARCRACRLWETRTHAVPGEGPAEADIMLVGEGPGEAEDLSGRPFVGRTGEFLNRFLAERGIERSELFITSSVKCRPPSNRDPKPDEIETCREKWLLPQIEAIRPRVILLAGKAAVRSLAGWTGALGKAREMAFTVGGVPALATYHPTAAMRFPKPRAGLAEDIERARELAIG